MLGPILMVSDSLSLKWDPRVCFYDTFPSDVDAVGPRAILWEPMVC